MNEVKNYPLKGVRVVEFGSYIAVPLATRMLAEWGAEVIKVEGLRGEDFRYYGANMTLPVDPNENALFANTNMNKKIICVDVKKPEGIAILKHLIGSANIFVSNIRMKSLVKYGLDYETLSREFPSLIYGYFTGYGTKGPEASRPGFDSTAFWARGGLLDWVAEGDHPAWPGAGLGDTSSSSMFCAGILAALYGQKITGKGTYMDNSLYGNSLWYNFESVIPATDPYTVNWAEPEKFTAPLSPLSMSYQSKDKEWIMILPAGSYDNGGYAKYMHALGLEQYVDDTRFNNMKEAFKVENRRTLFGIITEQFAQYTAREMCDRLEAAGVTYERMRHFNEMYKEEQAYANDYVRDTIFHNGVTITMPAIPVKFGGYDEAEWKLPGLLGCDTKSCLMENGFSEAEIERLSSEGIIKI